MTLAVCIRCGNRKLGACDRCGFDPQEPEDQAKALLLSDHHQPPELLHEIGQHIEEGELPTFDPEAVQQLSQGLSVADRRRAEREVGRFIWTCFTLVVLMVVGLIYLLEKFVARLF